jgi:glyoxylase-like metal-dependent hydrolase (beta-lactamase superfamily II)
LIFGGTGLVKGDLYVTGFAWSPVYLLACERPVLFEAGFYCIGSHYEKQIREILHDRRPEMLFLTHVHYDHCGAAQHIKDAFPEVTIADSHRAAEIAGRPGAQTLMRELSRNMIQLVDMMEGVDKEFVLRDQMRRFDVGLALEDGQPVQVQENLSVQVMSAPGHTRDMLSYYIPERKILFATEAAGSLNKAGQIITEFLVDYDEYMHSLKRLAELDVEVLCQGHHLVFTEKSDVDRHFEQAINGAEEFKKKVEILLDAEQGSVDQFVSRIKSCECDPNPGPKQPERAYLINLRTRVAHLAEKLLKL